MSEFPSLSSQIQLCAQPFPQAPKDVQTYPHLKSSTSFSPTTRSPTSGLYTLAAIKRCIYRFPIRARRLTPHQPPIVAWKHKDTLANFREFGVYVTCSGVVLFTVCETGLEKNTLWKNQVLKCESGLVTRCLDCLRSCSIYRMRSLGDFGSGVEGFSSES